MRLRDVELASQLKIKMIIKSLSILIPVQARLLEKNKIKFCRPFKGPLTDAGTALNTFSI